MDVSAEEAPRRLLNWSLEPELDWMTRSPVDLPAPAAKSGLLTVPPEVGALFGAVSGRTRTRRRPSSNVPVATVGVANLIRRLS